MKAEDIKRAAFLLKTHQYLTKELTATVAEYKDEIEDEDTTDDDLPLCLRKENGQFMLTSVALDGSESNHNFARIDRDLAKVAVQHLLGVIAAELGGVGVTIE